MTYSCSLLIVGLNSIDFNQSCFWLDEHFIGICKMEFTWLIYIHFIHFLFILLSAFSLMIFFLINKKILFNFIENYCFLFVC